MLSRSEYRNAQARAVELIKHAGIRITKEEKSKIEIADFGLNRLEKEGAQILTLLSTDRISAKIIVLFPRQTMPEHWHPPVGNDPGKEETLRIVEGSISFYQGSQKISMKMGDQTTIAPGVKHRFQAGRRGAVMFSISTTARDILDQFTNPDIVRTTKIAESARKG